MSAESFYLQTLLGIENPDDKRKEFLGALSNGLNESWFADDKAKEAFNFIRDHYFRYNAFPTYEIVEVETTYTFPDNTVAEPCAFWFDELRRCYVVALVQNGMDELAPFVESQSIGDIQAKLQELTVTVSKVTSNRQVSNLLELGELALEQHDHKQQNHVQGIYFGIEHLDRVTGGAQPGDLISLIGRISVGKSFTEFRLATGAYEAGHRPMLVNMEMQNRAVGNRVISLGAHISNTMLRHGMLPYYTRRHLVEYLNRLRTSGRADDFIFIEGGLNMSTADLVTQIRRYRPDIVFVDGAYLLRNTYGKGLASVERIKIVAEELKQIAGQEDIPIVPSYQFARGGEKKGLEGIGWSDAIGQVSTLVLGLTNEEDDGVAVDMPIQYKLLEILKGREGESGKIRLLYDYMHSIIRQDSVLEGNNMMNYFYYEPDEVAGDLTN